MDRLFSTTRTMPKRISFQVSGRVQGVFFRAFTIEQANAIHLTGWVKNASDGTVVGEAQGSDEQLARFVQQLHQGPPASQVDKVVKSEVEVRSEESGFEK
ncbi:Acylphosphatase-like domain-containing protein [Phyllosticta citrichinensis]|uniref:Acylphosphatase n=1 Tax=Phyllosticta citrichinensis TaxID=1130410 RepID=A0ABR1XY76_9PEZI